jgi:Helix-turn-helix domain
MSVEAMALVLHHSNARGTAKVVLLGIANHDGDGGAWPSHDTLTKYAHVDERNVRRTIQHLVELGELRVEVRGGGNHNSRKDRIPNRYYVLVRCPEDCDGTTAHRNGGSVATSRQDHGGSVAPSRSEDDGGSAAPSRQDTGGHTHPERGDADDRGGGSPAPPEPYLEPSKNLPVSSKPGGLEDAPEPDDDELIEFAELLTDELSNLLRSKGIDVSQGAAPWLPSALDLLGHVDVADALELMLWVVDGELIKVIRERPDEFFRWSTFQFFRMKRNQAVAAA